MIVFVCRGCSEEFVSLRSAREHARKTCFSLVSFDAKNDLFAKDI